MIDDRLSMIALGCGCGWQLAGGVAKEEGGRRRTLKAGGAVVETPAA